MPATPQDLREYHEAAAGASEIVLATVLDTARWDIETFAPAPDTTDAAVLLDYDDRLTNAQLHISKHLYDTGDYSGGGSVGLDDISYSERFDSQGQAVLRRARRIMSPYLKGSAPVDIV